LDYTLKPHFNTKYTLAFRKQAISLYRRMTAREVASSLGIKHGQVIGIMETSRLMGLISEKFKDKRNKTPWTEKERLQLIRMAGLVTRKEIGRRIGRPGRHTIKDRIKNDFNSGTKFLHGMPATWIKELIPIDLTDRLIKTTAGPTATNFSTNFRIVPWVELEQVSYAVALDKNLAVCIRILAKFQRFIWQTDEDHKIRELIEGIINGRK
jgi:hypothetical protein